MQFYRLSEPRSDSPEHRTGGIDVRPEEGFSVGDAPKCGKCGRFLGMLSWLPPHRLELQTWGKHYGDIARTGDDLIVSQRFVQVFTNSSLIGVVQFEPVDVVKLVHHCGKPKELMPKYFKATAVRSPTTIDQDASGYVWEDESKVCPECLFDTLKRYRSLIVKQETWNGDDVFYPRGGNGPLVSERFKKAFIENSLHGAVFIPGESPDAGYDSYPWETETASKERH